MTAAGCRLWPWVRCMTSVVAGVVVLAGLVFVATWALLTLVLVASGQW